MCEYLFRWEGYTGVTVELVGKGGEEESAGEGWNREG